MTRSNRKVSDFAAEIESHLEMEVERLREQGMSEEEARTTAHRAFGNVTRAQERFVEARRRQWLDHVWRDVRFGLRVLVRSPSVAVIAVLTLALGIGATTAVFSAVYLVMLKPLPFRDPGRLVFVLDQDRSRGISRNNVSAPEILGWRNDSGAFEDFAAYEPSSCVLTGEKAAEQDPCEIVTSNLFPLLGGAPFLGRVFTADEDRVGSQPTAILSYELWRRRFNADATAIGRGFDINGTSYTLVGVMPASFSHLYTSRDGHDPELWLSGIALSPTRPWHEYFGVGRLRTGISLDQAARQMDQVSARLELSIPSIKGWRAQIESLRTEVSGESRLPLIVLMSAVVFLLLIACVNVANLLLARSTGRATEFAVRNALGARPAQIVRQLLTESSVISLIGGALGILLAYWGCKGLAALAPAYLLHSAPALGSGALNLWVLGFAFVTVVGTTVLFGLAPALQSARTGVQETLKSTSRTNLAGAPGSRRLRDALIVSGIGLAMVLLVAAGLMIRTLASLSSVDLGLRPERVLGLGVPLIGDRYKEPQARVEFWRRVVATVSTLPGVESASVSRGLPIGDWAGQPFTTAEEPTPTTGQTPSADYVIAGPEYFRLLDIPLRQGRVFNESDTQSTEKVAVVNEELARLYWPGKNPIGKQLRVGLPPTAWLTIVGVTGTVRSNGPDVPPTAAIYIPYQQYPWLLGGPNNLLVRAAQGATPESIAHAIVQQIHEIDRDQPATDLAPLEDAAHQPMAQQRMLMVLLSSFGGLALVLGALGIYSVLSYSVAQRTREIGVRLALGGGRSGILWLVVGDSVRLAFLGIAIGTIAALVLTRVMTHLLFGVGTTDLATFCAVALLLALTAILSSYIPARRAIKIDPMAALRYE
jgi:putative ABC transport system permease protein